MKAHRLMVGDNILAMLQDKQRVKVIKKIKRLCARYGYTDYKTILIHDNSNNLLEIITL